MKKLMSFALVMVVAGVVIAGCSVGMSPEGASAADEKAMFDKLPLEERAKQLMALPGPKEDKIAKVKAMYEKAGQKMPDNIEEPKSNVPPHG